jgi:hypothetical protein
MRFISRIVTLGLVSAMPVFAQVQEGRNASGRSAPNVEIDYEAIRLSRVVTAVCRRQKCLCLNFLREAKSEYQGPIPLTNPSLTWAAQILFVEIREVCILDSS